MKRPHRRWAPRPVRRPARQTTTQRGYGTAHQKLRRDVAKIVDAGGAICWRCGRLIVPGEPWDLGHRDDVPGAKIRGIYAGPEHRSCSRSAGAWKKRGVLNPQMPSPRNRPRPAALNFFGSPDEPGTQPPQGITELET